ncbi:MAG: FtsX-like permease family protein [bacterium]|nr:FtsX-like permease family protein [bacterium]
MGLIFKIAWRNIFRHKGKSFVIGTILFLGALFMTLGNGVISGMDRGLTKNIIEGFTGHIVIISDKQETDNVLFTLMGKPIEAIGNFIEIKKVLNKEDYIDKYLPVGRNLAMLLNEEGGSPGNGFLLGVDFAKYRAMFPDNIKPVEGTIPEKNEKGVILPSFARKEFYGYTNIWFVPTGGKLIEENFKKETKEKEEPVGIKVKDSMVVMGFNDKNTTMDVRVNVRAVVRYNTLNTIFGHFALIDIESYREAFGYFSAESKASEISEDKKKLLDMGNENLDMLFSENTLMTENKSNGKADVKFTPAVKQEKSEVVDVDTGAYNLVFIKLKKGISIDDALLKMNKDLKSANLGVRAVSWKKAFGLIGSMSTVIKGALFLFVMLLFVVAVIIIVNTLSMAAIERTPEIGMMRAVGARKSFISNMFLAETGMLSFVFGGAGVIVGIITVNLLPLFKITSENDMVQLLFGGDMFYPVLSMSDIMLSFLQLAIVTFAAVIYPIKVAKSITPLDAIVRD